MSASPAPSPSKPPRPDLTKVPPPPREPSARARELVFGYQGGQWILLIVGVMFTAMGSLFTLVFGWGLPYELLLDISASTIEGRLVSAELDPSYKINKRSATRVTVEYEIGKRTYRAEAVTIDHDLLERAEPGARLDVEYLDWDPEVSRVAGQTRYFFGHIGLFVLIFPALGLTLLFFAVRSNRREIRAFTHGEAAIARVVYFGEDLTTKQNNRHPTIVRWELDLDGKTYTGDLSHMERSKLAELENAQELIVLHDRDDPRINTAWIE
jgi:hypothetical protein